MCVSRPLRELKNELEQAANEGWISMAVPKIPDNVKRPALPADLPAEERDYTSRGGDPEFHPERLTADADLLYKLIREMPPEDRAYAKEMDRAMGLILPDEWYE